MMRKTLVTGGVVAVALGLGALTAATAAAAESAAPNGVVTRSTTSYTSPSNQSAPVAALAKDTTLELRCFTEGVAPPGSKNFYWFRIVNPDGPSSYIHRDSVTVAPGLKHC